MFFSIFALTLTKALPKKVFFSISDFILTKVLPKKVFFSIFDHILTKALPKRVFFSIFALTLTKALPQGCFSLAIAIDSGLSAAKSLLPAGCHQRICYCQPAVTSKFAADSQYNFWMKLGVLLHGSLCLVLYGPYFKLEDLKVLRRSPDLLNNVKIGQGNLQFIMKQILFANIWGLQPFGLNNLMNNPSNS